jgi:ubiquinone/menaquinone biosynthesis C-methylase UbiE
MASSFNVRTADGYEQLMGRWSKMLAPPFIEFAGVADGERILDIGCGNGSLTFALLKAANVSKIMAVDYSPVFVAEVTRLNSDPRIMVREADATALPFDDRTFARSLSLLVLHFVPDAERVISEMKRVVEPGGVVAAAVWDHLGGMPGMRMMLDTVAMLDDSGHAFRERFCFQPMTAPDEMKNAFIEQGLLDVEETSLLIRMTYESFEDYWKPIAEGEGPLGGFLANRNSPTRTRMESAVRDAYEAGRPDGIRSFVAVAWACRGIVPG